MKWEEWKELEEAADGLDVDGRYQIAYVEFMYNPENEYNCEECPHNNPNVVYRRVPCGQQNCWVWAHCYSRESEER